MTRLVWNQETPPDYEVGLDRGVFYPLNGAAQAWDGLISVEESSSDTDARSRYLDGQKIHNAGGRGQFNATIEAFTFPEGVSGLTSTTRSVRGDMSYRVATPTGHKIHLIFNALLTPTSRSFEHDSASTFSWELTTRAIPVADGIFTSHMVIDTSAAYPETIEALEAQIYGSESFVASLPDPKDILRIFEDNSILQIIDHGDGTWTAIGPDDVVYMISADEFRIDYPTAVYLDAVTYTVHSL